MKRRTITLSLIALAVIALAVSTTRMAKPPTTTPCSEAWFTYLEKEYDAPSDDGEGHGPDRATAEWFYSFETKMGLPTPDGLGTVQHCQATQQQLQRRTILISSLFGQITLRR